jgi:6-phosphogluconate dehydrogenase
MKLAIIGLGKMGANMSKRLLHNGHEVVAHDINPEPIQEVEKAGASPAYTLDELVSQLTPPRIIWVMVPDGPPVETTLQNLADRLSQGDIVIDGGNSNYKNTVRRGEMLQQKGIYLVDVGTSGGIWGLAEGYSMMVGGEAKAVETIRPILETLAPAPDKGWGHVGPPGSGHFVKMIHNGIEYGLMQAYAEGFEILQNKKEFNLDLHQVAEVWRYGSVIRSWLLDLASDALAADQTLSDIEAYVPDSGEGRWAVFEAIDLDIPAPVITLALQMRLVSRQEDRFAARLLAALRHQFGGHAVKLK